MTLTFNPCVSRLLAYAVALVAVLQTGDSLSQETKLAGRVQLARCVDLISLDQSVTIVYDAADLQALRVSIRGEIVDVSRELVPIVQRELRAAGLAVVPTSPESTTLSIVSQQEAFSIAPVSSRVEFESRTRSLRTYWRVRVPTNALSEQALQSASRLVDSAASQRDSSRTSMVVPLTESNEAVVSGDADRVASVLQRLDALMDIGSAVLVRTIGVPAGEADETVTSVTSILNAKAELSFHTYRGVLNASADGSAVVLVAPPSELELWTAAINEVTRPNEIRPQQYRIDGVDPERLSTILMTALEAVAPGEQREVRSFANPLTGALTIWTDVAGHEYLSGIVEEVTNPSAERLRQLATVPVHHRDASALAGKIESTLLALAGLDSGTRFEEPLQPEVRDSAEITTAAEPSRRPDTLVSIDSDEDTNSLIVIGTPVEIEQVRELVDELDIPAVQVQLEVLLLSLSESDTFDLGIELTKIQETGGTTFRLSSLFGLGVDAAAATLPGAATGGTGVVLDPGEFAALVAALETLNEGRSLSMPSVLVANNQTADFNSVLQQPVVNLDITDAISSQSFGGFEDAGTNISVDPQILAGDRLNLTYSVTLSTFVGESSSPSTPPPRQQNQLSSAVTIPDGHTVALGGIELQTEAYAESGIPLISSIPWLGELFKTRSRSDSRTRFYVFIRANVHRDPMLERLRYASDQLVDELDLPDGWPEIEPRVIR